MEVETQEPGSTAQMDMEMDVEMDHSKPMGSETSGPRSSQVSAALPCQGPPGGCWAPSGVPHLPRGTEEGDAEGGLDRSQVTRTGSAGAPPAISWLVCSVPPSPAESWAHGTMSPWVHEELGMWTSGELRPAPTPHAATGPGCSRASASQGWLREARLCPW